MSQQRLGITIDLRELKRLSEVYIEEVGQHDPLVSWRMTDFLLWVTKQKQLAAIGGRLRQRERQSVAAATTEICQCEVYQTCNICRGTDRDFSERARELNKQR